MTIEFTCLYCNYSWMKELYSQTVIKSHICPKCKDTSLKIRNKTVDKVDYYKGSPDFDEETDEDNNLSIYDDYLSSGAD